MKKVFNLKTLLEVIKKLVHCKKTKVRYARFRLMGNYQI
jgi:hypothetical protein